MTGFFRRVTRDAGSWRLAESRDLPAISSLLRANESWACSLSSRLPDGRVQRNEYLFMNDAASALVFATAGGFVFPLGISGDEKSGEEASMDSMSELALRLRVVLGAAGPSTAMGRLDDLDFLDRVLLSRAPYANEYFTMSLQGMGHAWLESYVRGVAVREADPRDLDELLPLQLAYEREEVNVPLHEASEKSTRAQLALSLKKQRMFVALREDAGKKDGRIVAKAQTNARGHRWEQLGGIYVDPDERRHGIARALVGALSESIFAEGKGVSLFVKKGNAAALALYRDLGFAEEGDFGIRYYR